MNNIERIIENEFDLQDDFIEDGSFYDEDDFYDNFEDKD